MYEAVLIRNYQFEIHEIIESCGDATGEVVTVIEMRWVKTHILQD
jgi:hypothetical protein